MNRKEVIADGPTDQGHRERGPRRRRQEPLKPVSGPGWMAVPEPIPGRPHLRRLTMAHVTSAARRRLDAQIEWTRAALDLWLEECRRPYVAYSGGKDSAVLLDIAVRHRPGIEAVLTLDAEGSMPGVREAAAWWREERGVTVHEYVWGAIMPSIRERGRAIMDLGAVTRWTRAQGFDGVARGLRAEESKGRRWHARTHPTVVGTPDGYWIADPILWWTAGDVWAYHALHQLPYNEAYDIDDGTPRDRRRIGSPWGLIGASYGRIARLKRLHYDLYQQLDRVAPDSTRCP